MIARGDAWHSPTLHRCGRALAGAGYVNPGFAPWRGEAAYAHLYLGETARARELVAPPGPSR